MIKIFLKPIALMLAAAVAVIVIISTFGANKGIPEDANKGESDFSAAAKSDVFCILGKNKAIVKLVLGIKILLICNTTKCTVNEKTHITSDSYC
jgi:hypothetical protein